MDPSCIQREVPSKGSRRQTTTRRTATWICLPYFSLEPYSALDGTSSGFPPQTLLQAQFSGVRRERDMQQAVHRIKQAPPGHCFHIAQLWCLVLDNCAYLPSLSTLLLCGNFLLSV